MYRYVIPTLLYFCTLASAADQAAEVKRSEHCRAHDLFPAGGANWVAARNGDWSDPKTWAAATSPGPGARVLIPDGREVGVVADHSQVEAIAWVRVDGQLNFAADRDTGLKVGSLFVAETGTLAIGAPGDRVAEDCTSRLVFAIRQTREGARATDPSDLLGGLISFGQLRVFGAEKTPFALASGVVSRGAEVLEFMSAPSGWRVGDRVLVPGVSPVAKQDEVAFIEGISGDGLRISLDRGLEFDHHTFEAVRLPVGNLTRNVVFESEGRRVAERGHVMIMHQQTGTRIEGAAFHRLGRTRADRVHTRPQVGDDGLPIAGSDANPIGRYSLHFHGRTGASVDEPPHVVRGCVITESPKHGLVNHGAHVRAEGNVTYKIRGSHFFGENGSEIGVFRGNLAVRSGGSGEDLKSRMFSADMGHTGHGFWLQGGGIELVGNYAFGHRDAAYIYHMKPHMVEGGEDVRFAAANLKDAEVAAGAADVDPADVPIYFDGNVAAGCGSGLAVRYHKRAMRHSVASVFKSSVFWGNSMERHGIDLDYSRGITLRDLTVIGEVDDPRAAGVLTNGESGELICENVRVEGFGVGIVVPRRGENRIVGGELNNRRNVLVQEAVVTGRSLTMSGVGFSSPSRAGRDPFDVVLLGRSEWLVDRSRFPVRWHADELANLPMVFEGDRIFMDGKRLYFPEQAFGAQLQLGLGSMTAGELFGQYGLAVAGGLAPPNAVSVQGVFGLVGDDFGSGARAVIELRSARWTNQLRGYVPLVEVEGRLIEGEATDLQEGWNVVRLGELGRSVLVFGDTEAPELELTNRSWKIHPDDIAYGFLVKGRLHDRVGTARKDRKFRWLAKPLPPAVGGVIRVAVPAGDLAGNEISVLVVIEVTEEVRPRQANIDDWRGY